MVLVQAVHSQAVVQTRGFHELSDMVLAQVLRSDHLAADELDLVQAVREWAHVSSVSAARRGGALPKPLSVCSIYPSLMSHRQSWGARYLRWPLCLCRSCACPCWHPASWQRWKAKINATCSSQ